MPRQSRQYSLFTVIVLIARMSSAMEQLQITADHPDGIYHVGETVRWTVSSDHPLDGPLKYSIRPGQGEAAATGELEISKAKPGIVQFTFTKPSTVLLKIGEEKSGIGGAIADPGSIAPSAPPPVDFDAFWEAKLKELHSVPMDARSAAGDAGMAQVKYESITMNNIRGKHIRAQLARPATDGKFPALLILQWAGVYGLDKSWVTDRAKDGWLALDVMPHDLPIDQSADYYKRQFEGSLKNYWAIGNDDRETSYFLPMYLSCYRAAEYLRSRPDWDGKTLVVMGGSQGGQQTLMLAGLFPGITAAMANVPAGCDMLGPAVGRRGGWPQWYDWTEGKNPQSVYQASRYFDVVNFAKQIKCPVLVGAGLLDQTSPVAGVCAAFNQISSAKELILMPHAGHQSENYSQADYDERLWGGWLPRLVRGTSPVKPN